MLRLIAARVGWAIPTLLVVVTLSFFLIRAAPGGPFDLERPLDPVVMDQPQAYLSARRAAVAANISIISPRLPMAISVRATNGAISPSPNCSRPRCRSRPASARWRSRSPSSSAGRRALSRRRGREAASITSSRRRPSLGVTLPNFVVAAVSAATPVRHRTENASGRRLRGRGRAKSRIAGCWCSPRRRSPPSRG